MSSSNRNHSYLSPLRYPGGKGNLANYVKLILSQNSLTDGHYVEVFAGGAGIAWSLLIEEYVQQVHINDLNMPLIAFWRSVVGHTDEICKAIADTPVTMDEWYKQRAIQQNPANCSEVEIGFSTFFLNRTNRSGILQGGVIGGKNQDGTWKIDARYNKTDLINRIQQIARYKHRIHIYNQDAAFFIRDVLPTLHQKTLVYLDPPYFQKGQKLYENHYNYESHKHIAKLVAKIKQPWLVSYDSCPEIDGLYSKYRQLRYSINYSAQDRYSGSEVLFFSKKIKNLTTVVNPVNLKIADFTRPLF
ncbi:MAG TPA: DNA adenine methylase [Aggregatilineales bacterium]|nr:DNA adenine methylase [Aggregatilineales bacterium]